MPIKTTYLEMFVPPGKTVAAPRDDLLVLRARHPTIAWYRFLYDAVGNRWNWVSRRQLPDAQLAQIIHDPLVEIHVLFADGVPAGFAELDRRVNDEIELKQFGLMAEFIGQGLGRYFLRRVIEMAFGYEPRRFWLHTCTADHPAALPNYLKAGFTIYKEVVSDPTDQ